MMNSADITSTVYNSATNSISIPSVRGDIIITINAAIIVDISDSVTFTGSGKSATFNTIDCTEGDLYLLIPFVDEASQLKDTTTAESSFCKTRTILYRDAECTNVAGYWYNEQMYETDPYSSTHAQKPPIPFNVKQRIAPKGYYAKLLFVHNTSSCTSNDNFYNYIETYAQFTLES